MKLSIKKQLIGLMLKNASYKLMWSYLTWQSENNLLSQTLTIEECHSILKSLREFRSEIFKKNISFDGFIVKEINLMEEWSRQSILFGEEHYPPLWYYTPQPPILVFYQGNLDLLNFPMLSIIGTRQATDYGRKMTTLISKAMVDASYKLVSGLALGIDQTCHQAASNYQDDSTIAILPCGHFTFYPQENAQLERRMYDKHLVLSEFLPYSKPKKHQFIMRNRLVAGISKATIVIEAAQKSGSLITANYALQYNREVFVLPGRVTDKQSYGCNELIQAGAHPILSTSQLAKEINEIFHRQGYK